MQDDVTLKANLTRICNQIFKLLPAREEGKDWQKPLETLLVELLGMYSLFPDREELLSLICKLEGLRVSTEEQVDFYLYRRTIFEACGITTKIAEQL